MRENNFFGRAIYRYAEGVRFCCARSRLQIVASPAPRRRNIAMPTDQERQTEAQRFMFYTLGAMTAAAVLVFLYLFNFTSFFKLAVPL